MKKLILFILVLLFSCKKEKELHINTPQWIQGSWCCADENILYSFSNEHFYAGQCSINSQDLDFSSAYSVDEQTSTSSTYYLKLRSHADAINEFTFTKINDSTMTVIQTNVGVRTYLKH